MIDSEVEAFLREHTRTFIITRRSDGSPTGYPMVGLWGDRALWFNTYRKSAKVRNLERDPRVCCLVTTSDFRGGAVIMRGRAEIVGHGDLEAVARDEPLQTVPDAVIATVGERLRSGKRIMVRVVPESAEFL